MAQTSWNKLADELGSILEKNSDGEDPEDHSAPAVADQLRQALGTEDTGVIAMALDRLEPEQAAQAFVTLEESRAVEVLGKLGPASPTAISESVPADTFRRLVEQSPERKAAAAVAQAPRGRARQVIEDVQRARPVEAEDLDMRLRYSPGTAGRLMTTNFVRLRSDMTAREALDLVRDANAHEDLPNDLYVVEPGGHHGARKECLKGVLSIRAALIGWRLSMRYHDSAQIKPNICHVGATRMDAEAAPVAWHGQCWTARL